MPEILFVHENELICPSGKRGRTNPLLNSSEPRKYFIAEEKIRGKLPGNIGNIFQSYSLSGTSDENKFSACGHLLLRFLELSQRYAQPPNGGTQLIAAHVCSKCLVI